MNTIPEALAIAVQHHQAGRLQAAEKICRQILAVEPSHADATHFIGVIAAQAGNLDEAVACYRRELDLRPNSATAHFDLGAVFQRQCNLDDAVHSYRRALALKPDHVQALNNLGNILREQGKLDEAVACYRRTVELKPDYAGAHSNLGNVLRDQGKLDEAVACYRRAVALKPNLAGAHYNLGNALKDQGRMDDALACYHRALELKPDFADAHSNLGRAWAEIGDFQRAEDAFRAALRHDSGCALAHYHLAELLGSKLSENDLAAQRRLLQEGELPDSQRLLLHFSVARVMDARNEYAEAAAHLERGNAIQLSEWLRRGLGYAPTTHESVVTQMITACTPDFFERVRCFGLDSEVPVFVFGLPRSGTTLIEQILASHSQVFGAGEIKLASDSLAALGRQDRDSIVGLRDLDGETAQLLASRHLEKLQALSPAALRIVDKMPDNYLFLGLLASLFPRAKFIHCRRDLHDVAVSCWMTSFDGILWASDQQHIASRFHEYQRIMEHWRKVLPVPLLEVDYEETVAEIEGVARKLVAWCGLEWEPSCLEFYRAKRPVSTASAVQVRQPVYSTSVGKWKHYEQSLATLLNAISAQPRRVEP